jgi:hypothetical protein
MTLGARLTRSTALAVPSFAVTAVTFTSAQWDTDNCFSPGSPTRLTCKTSGTYLIQGSLQLVANSAGPRDLAILVNGLTYIGAQRLANVGASTPAVMNIAATYRLNVNDYVELMVTHYATPSGTNLNIEAVNDYSPRFAMVRLAPL